MTEASKPPAENEGGQGWSITDGERLPAEAITVNGVQMVKAESMSNMPQETRQRLLAVYATTAAFELSNPLVPKSDDFQRKAAKEALIDSELDASYLKAIVELARESGLGNIPIVDTIEKMQAADIFEDDDTYWRALAIISHLYAREIGLKSDAA